MPVLSEAQREKKRERRRRRAETERRLKTGTQKHEELMLDVWKPVVEWDLEELARGRPRAEDGSWRGIELATIPRAVHEEAIDRFKTVIKSQMGALTLPAVETLERILGDWQVDRRGRWVVSPSVKLEAAKFLLEHAIGKPVQPVQADVSSRLQQLLSAVMVNPSGELSQGAAERIVDVEPVEEEDEELS